MAFDFTYPTPLPSTKGWGLGYPDCQYSNIESHPIFQGGVHEGIGELVDLLVGELQRHGYEFKPGWSWGFACRGTKSSSGDGKTTPSFHSWGIALDFNAPENVFGASTHNMPKWVVELMEESGFFWLGPSIKDWMHFSFVGSPADAKAMTEKARERLGEDVKFHDFQEGVRARIQGEPEPPNEGPKKFGWRFADWAAGRPLPDAHVHKTVAERAPHRDCHGQLAAGGHDAESQRRKAAS